VTFLGIKFLQTLQVIFGLTGLPIVLSGVMGSSHCLPRENLAFVSFIGILHIRYCNLYIKLGNL
jgi:hypothetical protein